MPKPVTLSLGRSKPFPPLSPSSLTRSESGSLAVSAEVLGSASISWSRGSPLTVELAGAVGSYETTAGSGAMTRLLLPANSESVVAAVTRMWGFMVATTLAVESKPSLPVE